MGSWFDIRVRRALTISAESREVWRLIGCSALIGVMAGYGAIAFYWLTGWLTSILTEGLAGYVPARAGARMLAEGAQVATGPTRPWVWAFLPALGGLLGGWLVFRFAPEAEGHGTDAAIDAYHHRNGYIRARVPFVKGIASALTIGTGGSAGAEGPIVQVGAGLASILARFLKFNPMRSRILMAAGMAAGVGAVFRAPTAAALFAAEVLYREMDLEFEVIIPCVVASIMAYAVFVWHMGPSVLFATQALAFNGLKQLPPYLLMGGILALGAYGFVRCFYGMRDFFVRLPLPRMLKPALGGLLVGGIGLFMPEVLGQSYGIVQQVLAQDTPLAGLVESVSVRFLLAVFVFKTLATAFSIGSGGSGGIFGPSLVAGAALGGACGLLAQRLFPGIPIQVGAFGLVGMAGFFAAAANTPISTIIMVSELTGDYGLLVPSMWVSVFAFVLARRYSIYEHQPKNRLEAPVHQGSMATATLRNATVTAALAQRPKRDLPKVFPETTLEALTHAFAHSTLSSLPLVDPADRLLGVVPEVNVRETLASGEAREAPSPGAGVGGASRWFLERLRRRMPVADSARRALLAGDLRVEATPVTPADTLFDALHAMSANDLTEVPVVDAAGRLIAVLTNADITAYYHSLLAPP